MFRYKKGMFGKWLLGVCGGYGPEDTEHCGHVFSEMEPYDAATAEDKAKEMVEMIRRYWMEQADALEQENRHTDHEGPGEGSPDTDAENDKAGTFVGFVLLSEPHWSPDKLAADMKGDWGLDCNEEEDEEASEERVSAGDKGEMTHDDEDTPHIYSVKGLRLVDVYKRQADNCPKQERTLAACHRALQAAREHPGILERFVKNRRLPLAELTAVSGVARKTLERHHSYMMAILLAYTNGYEIIRGHLCQISRGKEASI